MQIRIDGILRCVQMAQYGNNDLNGIRIAAPRILTSSI